MSIKMNPKYNLLHLTYDDRTKYYAALDTIEDLTQNQRREFRNMLPEIYKRIYDNDNHKRHRAHYSEMQRIRRSKTKEIKQMMLINN